MVLSTSGALTKLLGIVPAVAYNLILPMLFSFTGLGVFSLAYNLVRYRQATIKDQQIDVFHFELRNRLAMAPASSALRWPFCWAIWPR